MIVMLTPINSASSSTEYFSKDGYYTKDGPKHEPNSQWHGLAAELGLDHHVGVDDFTTIMAGQINMFETENQVAPEILYRYYRSVCSTNH